jgi:hypothetical protein
MLFSLKIMLLLAGQASRYYHQYLEAVSEGSFPLTDMTTREIYLFVSVIVQMGHNQRTALKDYWSTLQQLLMAYYGNTMKWGRFFHVLRFLHFSDKKNEPDETNENYDRLWKMRIIFDKLSGAYAKYYSQTKHFIQCAT